MRGVDQSSMSGSFVLHSSGRSGFPRAWAGTGRSTPHVLRDQCISMCGYQESLHAKKKIGVPVCYNVLLYIQRTDRSVVGTKSLPGVIMIDPRGRQGGFQFLSRLDLSRTLCSQSTFMRQVRPYRLKFVACAVVLHATHFGFLLYLPIMARTTEPVLRPESGRRFALPLHTVSSLLAASLNYPCRSLTIV